MIYIALKYIHVLLAITAVGTNFTYFVWLQAARSNSESTLFALRGIRMLDNRVANPCYGFLLITGIIMTWLGHIPFNSLWIDVALVIYVLVALTGALLYSPLLRRQIALAESGGVGSAEYASLDKRGTTIGITLTILVLILVAMMVFKPL